MNIELPIHGIKVTLGPSDPEKPGAFLGGTTTPAFLEAIETVADKLWEC